MEKFAILARVEAKPGKENEVLDFLKSALSLAEGEPETVRWYALNAADLLATDPIIEMVELLAVK
jgi:hypothetical protein